MTDRELINAAKKAAANAYAPYSRFSVGAALECEDGTVVTGCNVENAALGGTICAERVAACSAISQGKKRWKRLAVYSASAGYCTPCGTCRQFLSEFAPDLEILCVRGDGRYVSYPLSKLLPHQFNAEFIL